MQINSFELFHTNSLNAEEVNDFCRVYIWHHAYSQEELSEFAQTSSKSKCSSKRSAEKLSILLMVRQLLGPTFKLQHRPSGRPFLQAESRPVPFISISHSHGAYALSLSSRPHGIDIEKIDEKVFHLRSRFLSDSELRLVDILPSVMQSQFAETSSQLIQKVSAATLLWSAKEAAFKAFQSDALQTISQIALAIDKGNHLIACFEPAKLQGTIHFELLSDFILTSCESLQTEKKV